MNNKELQKKEICITNNCCVSFPKREDVSGNLLIIGNFKNICGDVEWYGPNTGVFNMDNWDEIQENNITVIIDAIKSILKNNSVIGIIASKETIDYFKKLVYTIIDWHYGFSKELTGKEKKKIFNNIRTVNIDEIYEIEYKMTENDNFANGRKKIDQIVQNKIFKKAEIMKFDTIIQNPPYNGSLHLDFFEKGVELLSENGKMVIIEPATWLINVRKNGKAKLYDSIKEKTKGHIKSVVIENLNKEFGTGIKVPFATTTIDMSETFDTIDFVCFGEHSLVNSIYDCNLVGNHHIINSILEKCTATNDTMANHTTKNDFENNYVKYLKYDEIVTVPMGKYGSKSEDMLDLPCFMFYTKLGKYPITYLAPAFSQVDGTLYDKVPFSKKQGASKELSNKKAMCVYGTTEELENWKHFIFNNKLPLFLNIVLTIDQNNNSKEFLPWLVDKQYTDEEINELFGFTDQEIKLINKTIEKYERNSPWFKRYMCGKDSVSDEEVNNFMEQLNKKYE